MHSDTAFKQQRLKAWQPILTPKTVLPTLFIIGLVFAPIGTVLIWASSLISEMTFDYTDCQTLTPSTNDSLSFTPLPSNKYSYRLRNGNGDVPIQPPRYAYLDNRGNSAFDVSNQEQCIVEFHVPINLDPSIFLYYKLTNFYQNHRRYVKSQNGDQLIGDYVSPDDLDDSDCDPLGSIDGVAIYPCGLIANSLFNGLLSPPSSLSFAHSLRHQTLSIPLSSKTTTTAPTKSPFHTPLQTRVSPGTVNRINTPKTPSVAGATATITRSFLLPIGGSATPMVIMSQTSPICERTNISRTGCAQQVFPPLLSSMEETTTMYCERESTASSLA